ncbi:Fic family protein [Fulvimarina sp. MAC8]|uniref:Fic family protein n=1 Tax=Fulvimarina sp. MAC8 TaxID=3162874 RepID=UPI0032EE6456
MPPHFSRVGAEMDILFSVVHENWSLHDNPVLMAAFVLWYLNWIHPFVEGNGRTARAACYYLICMKEGRLLPGRKIIPERIREDRRPYYDALKVADLAYEKGQYDVTALANYLQRLLREQLSG